MIAPSAYPPPHRVSLASLFACVIRVFRRPCLGLLLVLFSGSLLVAGASAGTPAPAALVRVDLDASAGLERLAATGMPVYARLSGADGQEYLLLPANAEQQQVLARYGFVFHILDPDIRGASYYQLTARRAGTIEGARPLVTILEGDERRAIARATEDQAEAIPPLGIEIARLQLHPLLAGSAQSSSSIPTSITPDPLVGGMMAQVLTTTVRAYDGGLSGEWPVTVGGQPYTIATRYSRTIAPIEKATQYAYEHFQSLGLPVEYQSYSLSGTPKRNVVAEQPGLTQPQRIFMITAHLDDMSNDSMNDAPGADDNASGSTGVLIAADILSHYQFGCTLRYALFTGEEQGLVGSEAYAATAASQGDDIEGVLNLDMVGYNSYANPDDDPIVDLVVRTGSAGTPDRAIANLFADVVAGYHINLVPSIQASDSQDSDHASFWNAGYPAILAIEDFDDFTPYYHKTGDDLSTLDLAYFTNFVKASIGTFAHMGCLIQATGQLQGHVSDAGSGTPISGATVAAAPSLGTSWVTASGAGGFYSMTIPSRIYTVTASAPGYMPLVVPGVQIADKQTVTLDFQLEVTPTWTITGYVRDAVTSEPLSATVSVTGRPGAIVQTDATGFYALTFQAPSGAYQARAEAADYTAQSWPLALPGTGQHDFALQSLCLLVVADDANGGYQSYYTKALDDLGKTYRVVRIPSGAAGPDLATMARYQGVIWFTGAAPGTGNIAAADRDHLARYLDGGGRLFMSGQDIGVDIGQTGFYRDYLHATYVANAAYSLVLTGQGPMKGLDITINGGDGADNQTTPDEILAAGGAEPIYAYAAPHLYGGVAYSDTYRTMYFSFGYEAINNQARRQGVMRSALNYLGVCGAPSAPVVGFATSTPAGVGITVAFTNTTRGTPWMSYTWDFGDGTEVNHEVSPRHSYAAGGDYMVTLTAASRYGQDAYSRLVSVPATCVDVHSAGFTFAPARPVVGEAVSFEAAAEGSLPVTYAWDFGGGVMASGPSVTHTYPITWPTGAQTVTLSASNDCPSQQTISHSLVLWRQRIYLPVMTKMPLE